MDRHCVNKRELDLSKEVQWVFVGQRASEIPAIKVGGLKKILPNDPDLRAAGPDRDAPLKFFERMAAKVQDNMKKYTAKADKLTSANDFLQTYRNKGHNSKECPFCLRGLHGEDMERFLQKWRLDG